MLSDFGNKDNEQHRSRIEKEVKEDPEQQKKMKEVKKRRREFVNEHLGESLGKKARPSDGG